MKNKRNLPASGTTSTKNCAATHIVTYTFRSHIWTLSFSLKSNASVVFKRQCCSF